MRALRGCLTLVCVVAGALPLVVRPQAMRAAEAVPLELEARIPLGPVKGRIDHLAFDPKRHRVFVAELGNGSVAVADLNDRKVVHTISGLKEPQGIAYVPSADMIYVASGGDGSVRLFRAGDYGAAGRIDLGDDADNIRVDTATDRIFVGYGKGALAVIDPKRIAKVADIPLRAHPESFQLAHSSARAFVNLPQRHEIAVVDRTAGRQVGAWALKSGGNYPMALDEETQRVIVAFRSPPGLGVFAMRDGAMVMSVATCGDADDLFFDPRRRRVYVSCGAGFVDVFDAQNGYRRLAQVPTAAGARTSLFIPDIDRMLVAVPAALGQDAELWVFRSAP